MGHIFISYSHKDSKYARKLETALKKRCFDVWIDERIDYGTQWPKVIQKHLDECVAFIVIVSENSSESEWVQNEVTRAKRKKKPFFPLLLSGDLWISIETTQYADVRGGKLPPKMFYTRLSGVVLKGGKGLSQPKKNSSKQTKASPSASRKKSPSKSSLQSGVNISGNVEISNSKVAGRDIVDK